MCMKCFLTYDDALSFSKHLYHKHEEEHKVCRTCHAKTWAHVFHFCVGNGGGNNGSVVKRDSLTCEVCEEKFAEFRKYR
jgi:hypothetical protein